MGNPLVSIIVLLRAQFDDLITGFFQVFLVVSFERYFYPGIVELSAQKISRPINNLAVLEGDE